MLALTQRHPRLVVLRKSAQAVQVQDTMLFCDLWQLTDTPATVRQSLKDSSAGTLRFWNATAPSSACYASAS